MICARTICRNISLWLTGFFCRFCWNKLAFTFFLLPLANCFLRLCIPAIFEPVLKFFIHWELQQFLAQQMKTSQHPRVFQLGRLIYTKGTWNSPINLFRCKESPPKMSTNTSMESSFYLSWSNHLVASFRLEINVGRFTRHQNKTSDAGRDKG